MIREDSRRYQRPHLPALTARSVFFMFFDMVDMTVCMSFANMWGKIICMMTWQVQYLSTAIKCTTVVP